MANKPISYEIKVTLLSGLFRIHYVHYHLGRARRVQPPAHTFALARCGGAGSTAAPWHRPEILTVLTLGAHVESEPCASTVL